MQASDDVARVMESALWFRRWSEDRRDEWRTLMRDRGFRLDRGGRFSSAAGQRGAELPHADHSELWRHAAGNIFVTQPYGDVLLDPSTFMAIVKRCEEFGLLFYASARLSWHYPGGTILIAAGKPGPMRLAGLANPLSRTSRRST